MQIVGITGAIGSGKTTFGTFLGAAAPRHLHLESSSLIIEIANELLLKNTAPLPISRDIPALNRWLKRLPTIIESRLHRQIAWEVIKINENAVRNNPENYQKLFEYLELLHTSPALQRTEITAANKSLHRPILQWIGGYLAKQVGGDIWYQELIHRGQNDSDLNILTLGGVRFPADAAVIREHGGIIIGLQRPSLETQDGDDITERERSSITPDVVIINNGSIDELEQCARIIYADLVSGSLQNLYTAKPR